MKKHLIITLLTGAFLLYVFYTRWQFLHVATKEEITSWTILLDLGMCLLLLAALVQYAVTRGRRSLLLKTTFFYYIFFPILPFLITLYWIWFGQHGVDLVNNEVAADQVKAQLEYLPAQIAMWWMLITLNRNRIVTPHADINPVNRGTRLLIHAIDLGFVLMVLEIGKWPIYFYWPAFLPISYVGRLAALKWVLYGLIFVYYLLMETITGTSLGKIVTGTVIVNYTGSRAGFGELLTRTIARFIPFDSLSFLLRKRGWHDSLSDTFVIKAKTPEGDDPVLQTGYPGSGL